MSAIHRVARGSIPRYIDYGCCRDPWLPLESGGHEIILAAMFQKIFASVSDKTGLVDFLQPYADLGADIVSSGGTAKTLREAGIEVTDVSDYTGFPEVMGGRVKTLHPKVHMGLLYRPDEEEDLNLLAKHEVEAFDLVVANLYPFARAMDEGKHGDELIEYIDIGGPSLLRAAAKNHKNICVVCDPRDYPWIQRKENLSHDDRKYLAAKVFQKTSSYDQMICNHFFDQLEGSEERPKPFHLRTDLVMGLRYGENPQQKARWYKTQDQGLHKAEVLQGKALSFNNLLDLNAAVSTVREFQTPTAVSIKHNNPCGVASDADSLIALERSLKADPMSVFGGIVAVNYALEVAHAEKLVELFLECVIAPDISVAAQEVFASKKNLRVLKWPQINEYVGRHDVKSVDGGLLVQELDRVSVDMDGWKIIGPEPNERVMQDLIFSWKVCASLKSNAIAVCRDEQTLGLGMGQVNRVDAVKQSLQRAKEFHPQQTEYVLASDAFFPFPDSIEYAAKNNVRWVIQPGGSVKDEEVIAAAQSLGVTMVMTGKRHFRH